MSEILCFEYEKGSSLEEADRSDGDADANESDADPAESGRPTGIAVAPWKGDSPPA
ncbi:hypothetical protein [Natrinema sp. CGMCC1.2065]|uniref:hypothetical protein n=1 Tax=Natrinema sp. CGMCC1.2065 TaxID=3445767 RepID=UPI003F4A0AAC